jgi:acetyl-CoA carboxylase biotin carboxyl carrier protein
MLEESNLKEIEVSQGDESVRISKQSKNTNIVENDLATINQIDTGNAIHEQNKNKDIIHNGNEVKSPIVGTFYRKPSPESEPFINVGDLVKKRVVLCIDEAMKMMNEIKSDYDGKIISIEINDEQPVEFGQTIIVIQ